MKLSTKNLKVQVIWNYTCHVKFLKKRVFPAININRSGTRREELITKPDELQKMWILRKIVHEMDEIGAIEFLIDKIGNDQKQMMSSLIQ